MSSCIDTVNVWEYRFMRYSHYWLFKRRIHRRYKERVMRKVVPYLHVIMLPKLKGVILTKISKTITPCHVSKPNVLNGFSNQMTLYFVSTITMHCPSITTITNQIMPTVLGVCCLYWSFDSVTLYTVHIKLANFILVISVRVNISALQCLMPSWYISFKVSSADKGFE